MPLVARVHGGDYHLSRPTGACGWTGLVLGTRERRFPGGGGGERESAREHGF